MRRRGIHPVVFTLALVLLCSSASYAIFPGQKYGLNASVGDGSLQVQLQHGWWQGADAWYSCFATNNIRAAQTLGLTLSPKLIGAANVAAPIMYFVTNSNNSGPVFQRSPISGPYSGLWAAIYITWLPGVTPWVITDASAPAGAPPGLPTINVQATYARVPAGPDPPGTFPTILDCPIFAIGPISNPWFKPYSLVPPYIYRIPQGRSLDVYNKRLTIPFWNVYCQDPITKAISVQRVIIPDASLIAIAQLIGANYAPLLGSTLLSARSSMWVIDWRQTLPGGALLKVLANQYLVLADCPTDCSWRNTDFGYSPVEDMSIVQRNLALISPEVLFTNVPFIDQQRIRGALLPAPGIPVNAPVICVR